MDIQCILPSFWFIASLIHFIFFTLAPKDPQVPESWVIYTSLSNYLNITASFFCAWMGCRRILLSFFDVCFFVSVFALLFSAALTLCTLGTYFLFGRAQQILNADSLFWATTLFYMGFSVALLLRFSLCIALISCGVFQTLREHLFQCYQILLIIISFIISLSISYEQEALVGTKYYLSFWSFTSSALLIYHFFLTHKENDTLETLLMFQKLRRIIHCFIHVFLFQGPVLFAFIILSEPSFFHQHSHLAKLYVIQLAVICPSFFEHAFYSIKRGANFLQSAQSLRSFLLNHFSYVSDGLLIESMLLLLYLLSHNDQIEFFDSSELKAWSSLYVPLLLIQFTFNFLMRDSIQKQDEISPHFLNMVDSLKISMEQASLLLWTFWAKIWGLFNTSLLPDQYGLHSFAILALSTIITKLIFWIFRFRCNLGTSQDISSAQLSEALLNQVVLNQVNMEEEAIAEEENLDRLMLHLEEVNSSQVSDRDCPICLMGLKEDRPLSRLIECNHVFHSECIFRWIKTKQSCPLDRRPLI